MSFREKSVLIDCWSKAQYWDGTVTEDNEGMLTDKCCYFALSKNYIQIKKYKAFLVNQIQVQIELKQMYRRSASSQLLVRSLFQSLDCVFKRLTCSDPPPGTACFSPVLMKMCHQSLAAVSAAPPFPQCCILPALCVCLPWRIFYML